MPHETEIIKLLTELVKLTKFQVLRDAQTLAREALSTAERKRVFDLTNGMRTVREIATITKVNKDTISGWWRDWDKLLLVEVVPGSKGKRKTLFTTQELGI